MDTVKRILDRGRLMRLHIGDLGPMPGVQEFECTGTVAVDRNSEYDSDESILTIGAAEYTGAVTFLDNERELIWQALMGKKSTDTGVADVLIENLQGPPIMLNVWDKQKTYFRKSYLVLNPTWTSFPYPTTVDGNTQMRLEFSAVRGIKFPNHALGFDVIDSSAGITAGTAIAYASGRTPAQLSRKFENTYVAAVVERTTDTGSSTSEYIWNYLCVNADLTTTSNAYLRDDVTAGAGNELLVFYAYTSTNEAGGYACQTS